MTGGSPGAGTARFFLVPAFAPAVVVAPAPVAGVGVVPGVTHLKKLKI